MGQLAAFCERGEQEIVKLHNSLAMCRRELWHRASIQEALRQQAAGHG